MVDTTPESILALCDRLEAESEAAPYYKARWVPDPAAVLRLTAALREAMAMLGEFPALEHKVLRIGDDPPRYFESAGDCLACVWERRRRELLGEGVANG